jgi:hypothetical protein
MSFESIRKLISLPLGKTGENARRIASAIILEKAAAGLAKALGPENSGNVKPSAFRDGKLFLTASHGVWAQEIALRQPELIRAVNQEIGRPEIKSIVIR